MTSAAAPGAGMHGGSLVLPLAGPPLPSGAVATPHPAGHMSAVAWPFLLSRSWRKIYARTYCSSRILASPSTHGTSSGALPGWEGNEPAAFLRAPLPRPISPPSAARDRAAPPAGRWEQRRRLTERQQGGRERSYAAAAPLDQLVLPPLLLTIQVQHPRGGAGAAPGRCRACGGALWLP